MNSFGPALRNPVSVGVLVRLRVSNSELVAIVAWFALLILPQAASASDDLIAGFREPPAAAKPRVFWWWLQTKYREQDITRDLEEMKRVGIGGALIWDNGNGQDPAIPQGPRYMGERWREIVKYAIREADRLGIEISLNLSSGACCGGPWITPEYAAQRLIWREERVEGPSVFSGVIPIPDGTIRGSDGRPVFYRDVAALAIRLPGQGEPSVPLKEWGKKSLHELHEFRTLDDYLHGKFFGHEPDNPGESYVESRSVRDISKHMDAGGRVEWEVPEGSWAIVRFGRTHTGAAVSGGPKSYDREANGLDIDHLSRKAMDLHFRAMGDTLLDDAGDLAGKTLRFFHCDSVETSQVNWSGEFREEFKKRRGYDLLPYLPILAGRIVDSRAVSNRFLYDFRKTFADCIAENHYGRFRELCHQRGVEYHAESGGPPPLPIDALECLGKTDIPMGEFWCPGCQFRWRVNDIERFFVRGPAAAAHIYGKKLVAAEAFTNVGPHWEVSPFDLKPTADRAFCEGVNRFFLHTFTHSPSEAGKPGYEYGAGTHFNPNVTWWPQAGAWIDYLSRCQFLLQQGLFVADVCYYYGDAVPSFVPLKHVDPSLGPGYDYDVTNSEVILSRMSVKDGRICLPDGMSYRLLVLPEWDAVPINVLRKITELVDAGATVVGPKPSRTPGLRDYPRCDKTVEKLADALWGTCDGRNVKEHIFGEGKIVWGKPLREVLISKGVVPDFEYTSDQEGTFLDYIHRGRDDAEIYFVANRKNRWEEVTCTFRVAGKKPELWDPVSGSCRGVVDFTQEAGRTSVPIKLAPHGSLFVVFRGPVSAPTLGKAEHEHNFPKLHTIQKISGPWTVSFDPNWGGPESVLFVELEDWSKRSEEGIKYYSGTATYTNTFDFQEKVEGARVFLDLGTVKNVAGVTLNGKALGVVWAAPWRVEITNVVRAGDNQLEVHVTNLWPNRLIGDQFLRAEKRFTNTNISKFTKESPLLKSGLLGPVTLWVDEGHSP